MHTFERNPMTVNKKFMEYFFPTVMTAMANNIALIVDSIIVGNLLGSQGLAAVNLLSPVIQLYFALNILFGLGTSTLISIAKGEQEQKDVEAYFTIMVAALGVVSILLVAGQMVFLDSIVRAISPDEALRVLVKQYYVPYILGTPFTMFLTGLSYCVRTDGRPKMASNALVVANVINLCLDFIYIEVFHFGIKGASMATISGNIIGLLIILNHFKHKDNSLHLNFGILRELSSAARHLAALVGVGLSGAMGALLITIRMAFLNTYVQSMGDLGSIGVVAMSINSSCQILISTFITGASQTMIPIVGVMLGQKDYDGVRMTLKKTWKVLLAANVIILILLEAFPAQVAGLFGITEAFELKIVVPSIRITTISFVGLSASFLFLYYFMATKKKAISTMISVINGVVLIIPLSYLLGEMFGIVGIWWAFVATQAGTLLILFVVVSRKKRKSNGRFEDFYLLEKTPEAEIASISFTGDEKSASEASKYILNFMKENGVSDTVALKIAVAVEEMAVNTKTKKAPADLDVRISIDVEEVILSIRDNGIPCNPLEAKKELWEELDISGMGVVKVLAKRVEYANVLGFNQTTLVIDNQ